MSRFAAFYYGALDMTRDAVTPVMNLRGLLDIADWTAGQSNLSDKDGDYSVFAPLMRGTVAGGGGLVEGIGVLRAHHATRLGP